VANGLNWVELVFGVVGLSQTTVGLYKVRYTLSASAGRVHGRRSTLPVLTARRHGLWARAWWKKHCTTMLFGQPLQVTVRSMLRDRCSVCLSVCLSVMLVCCGQTVGWPQV